MKNAGLGPSRSENLLEFFRLLDGYPQVDALQCAVKTQESHVELESCFGWASQLKELPT